MYAVAQCMEETPVMKTFLAIAASAAMAACTTAESLQQRPVDWTANYGVPWETMANCLQAGFPSSTVAPRYNQRNRTAALTISMPGIIAPGPVIAEYQVSQGDSDEVSRVTMKTWYGSKVYGRDEADRCGRGT